MYSTLVSVALFSALAIQGALAEFTVSTPAEISTCGSVKLSWEKVEGIKNFNVAIVSTENPCEDIIADLGDHKGASMTWNVTDALKPGDKVMISVLADDADEGWSGSVTVKDGCPKSSSSASSVAPSSSAAPSSAKPDGTTLVVNPAAAPTAPGTAPAAPESTDAAEAVGAANAGILGDSNGAFASVQLSASTLVLSAVAAVAALAL
ncbi:hypothetical protein C8Q76DRAFT_748789 [Earliella scabrosa]|nr:hypothetical protein C8Q76DRAFT_748789 [Earliella scabrosa]